MSRARPSPPPFREHYTTLCARRGVGPDRGVCRWLHEGRIDASVDRLTEREWVPLCQALEVGGGRYTFGVPVSFETL